MKTKRFISLLLALVMLMGTSVGISVSAQASMADEAEAYEMGTWYKGHQGWQGYSNRYFSFTIGEKSYVTIDCIYSGDFRSIDIYNSSGNICLRGEDISYKYNQAKDTYNGHYGIYLKKGSYYIDLSFGGGESDYKFKIQAEKQIKLEKGKITSISSKKSGQLTVKIAKVKDAIGYRIQYTTDERFKTNVKTVRTGDLTKTIKGLKKGKRYYVRVSPYTIYEDGTYVYGQTSLPKTIKVKK